MFGRKSIAALKLETRKLRDIIQDKNEIIHSVIMEPGSEKSQGIILLYKTECAIYDELWTGNVSGIKLSGLWKSISL